mgnify:CR=1 FL=1
MTPTRELVFSFPATTDSISEARHLVMSEAETLPFTAHELDDINLAVSEVFTNLVQHASGYRIRGVCIAHPRALEICFDVDAALAGHLDKTSLPAITAFSGRGIPLLHMLMPTVEIIRHEDGSSRLRLVKPVAGEDARDETHPGG